MIRLLGAVLVILSGYGLGQTWAEGGKQRLEVLMELQKGFLLLQGQMRIGGMDLETMFLDVAACLHGGAARLFDGAARLCAKRQAPFVQEIWEEALKDAEEMLYLEEDDKKVLLSFGRSLGFSSREQQESQASLVVSHLEGAIAAQKERNSREQKLYRTMGTVGALMVLVVLF